MNGIAVIAAALRKNSTARRICLLCGVATRSGLWALFPAVAVWMAGTAAVAEEENRSPVTSVRLLPGAPGPAEAAMSPAPVPAVRAPNTQPTTPGGRLPQYQLDHWHRRLTTDDEMDDPRLRMILSLGGEPMLAEVTITIDGVPFRKVREQRIHQILAELEQPAKELSNAEQVPAADAELSAIVKPVDPESDDATDSDVAPNKSSKQETGNEGSAEKSDAGEADETDAEKSDSDGSDANAESSKPPAVSSPTEPDYQLPRDLTERLRRQATATGRQVTPDELRWLLTNWVDGPTLLMLQDNFQRFRANERPVFFVLDRDRDGILSESEITQCVTSFQECDVNRDDLVEYTELERVAADPRRQHSESSHGGLIRLLPTADNAAICYRQLAARYESETVPRWDSNGDGQFDETELSSFRTAEPDLSVTVMFDTHDASRSTIGISSGRPAIQQSMNTATVEAGGIRMTLAGTPVVFSAVQTDAASDQISIGSVTDGYPLLPVLDPRIDGRFTLRELRELKERLHSFDHNSDGCISAEESAATVRICFGLGPAVHRELIDLRETNSQPLPPVTQGPEWFTRMDRNRDNDLSRSEFPGDDGQWTLLDTDNDMLVSADEALAYEKDADERGKQEN